MLSLVFIPFPSFFSLPLILWLTLNANVFSLQDDYIKTTEENVRSDESKWEK